jgi:superfamily II DNA or RNA helicase
LKEAHNRYRNLLVAATGTGKTVVSAFDYKTSEVIINLQGYFCTHREILQQESYFSRHFKDNNFGDLWVDGLEPSSNEYVLRQCKL